MYEISLVPDVKFELLRKQKMRNFIIFICLIVVAACAAVIVILLVWIGVQNVHLADQDNEIACRHDAGLLPDKKTKATNCHSNGNNFGTPVMKYQNVNELLTIQSQISTINKLNSNKTKLSRIFGVLDILLLNDNNGETIEVSEVSMNAETSTIRFDAVGHSAKNNGFVTLNMFRENAKKVYYDYGTYQRLTEDGDYVDIPSFCITERLDPSTDYIIGTYHKGEPGCEAPLIESKPENTADDEEGDIEGGIAVTVGPEVEKEDIEILRSYDSRGMKEDYKNNNLEGYANPGKYYFESSCVQYDEKGDFDEDATILECPLLSSEPTIRNSAFGRNSNGDELLTFTASLAISSKVFKSVNRHMQIKGPSRQNVTDSYVQIRDMFTEKEEVVEEVKE